ncbi:coil containing protein [Vibrio phage 1.170.O._10N.261.52.C3]|nr:coil containing protein [Vibrio phage 1.170.O._10N.261.52.C3]
MEIYLVGGAVRDILMGVTPKDYDYVVVGSSPEEMLSKGFKEVGKDFPVFLHPVSGEEYALARTERKVGTGYKGFECDWKEVTLEEDLLRRDLTINAIAIKIDYEATILLGEPVTVGTCIDLFKGQDDLKRKQFCQVDKDTFVEDPVRLLRLARFLARYPDFEVQSMTYLTCTEMEYLGELESLVPDRVWAETEKALKEPYPWRYFEFLNKFNFPFTKIFREMETTVENNLHHQEDNVFVHTMMVLKEAQERFNDPEVNFAALMHDFGKPLCYRVLGKGHGHDAEGVPLIDNFCKEWKIPNNYRDLAKHVSAQHQKIHQVLGRNGQSWARPKSIMKIFEQTNALQKPERFLKLLKVCESDAHGRVGISAEDFYHQRPYLEECLLEVIFLDTKPISKKMLEEGKKGEVIGMKIREERIQKIREVQREWKNKIIV